ncbi:hypothetical protein C9374_012167 [Naegleria lovaniensis]|uniref:Uncharacterized protein n=1 Tax=Naegleria lovaniensis TaxID=51637 RepID=A0AA88KCN3_NAELO|nr:uncharacterized protein C9374_012167 [Naegleria lovaniensis]KAG2373428.1 hypothetical protein C9374_012167 [Naegleria lovaniensis]
MSVTSNRVSSPQQSSAETRTLSQTSQQPVGRSVTSLASLRNSTTSSNTTNTTNTNTSLTSTSAYNTSQHGATQSMTQTDEDSPFRRSRAVFENIQRNNNASGSQSSNTSNMNRSNRHQQIEELERVEVTIPHNKEFIVKYQQVQIAEMLILFGIENKCLKLSLQVTTILAVLIIIVPV